MLYDPKWEQETKADPLTLPALIAWLETMPADTSYEWIDCEGGCIIGHYFFAVFGDGHARPGRRYADVFRDYPGCAYARVCSDISGPTTYGAALERARKLTKG